MMKLDRLPEMIPCDKRLHFMLGTIFVCILLMFSVELWLVFFSLITYAFGIELYQKITKTGKYETMDAIAVILGGLIVLVIQ